MAPQLFPHGVARAQYHAVLIMRAFKSHAAEIAFAYQCAGLQKELSRSPFDVA